LGELLNLNPRTFGDSGTACLAATRVDPGKLRNVLAKGVPVGDYEYSRCSHQYVSPHRARAVTRKIPISAHWNGQKRLAG
jgi:hypothetical protein